jgi:hypothetical protein
MLIVKQRSLIIIVIIAFIISLPFLIRIVLHSDNLRFCSKFGSYNIYFDRKIISYDDYYVEDQYWPILACGPDIKKCFVSRISANSTEKNEDSKLVKFKNTLSKYDDAGELEFVVDLNENRNQRYNRCQFPLFR